MRNLANGRLWCYWYGTWCEVELWVAIALN